MNVSQNVLDAIDILTDNAVQKAKYDKTIQAMILSCQDETIGQYRCKYQDSTIIAFSTNTDVIYTQGSMVYIQVPQGDFSKQKTILGSTSKLGINYISQAVGDQAYEKIGANCIKSSGQFYLNTNNKDYIYTIYTAPHQEDSTDQNTNNESITTQETQTSQTGDNESTITQEIPTTQIESGEQSTIPAITINDQAIQLYLKESSSIILGASIQTSIDPVRQLRGHYGMIFNLTFNDNASGAQVTRSYMIDENLMVDNPYRLTYKTRQYEIFDIDGPNFVRVQSIQIFNKDFPNANDSITNELLESGDIVFSDFEITGAVRMSESQINGIAINLQTPDGKFFNTIPKETNEWGNIYRRIIAQVKIKGKLATAAQKIAFYWGRQHIGVTAKSKQYNRFLGRGWQCLNQFNIIQSEQKNLDDVITQEDIIQWVPGSDTYVLYLKNALAENNRFKVAIVYDGTVVTKQINIQNLASNAFKLSIESDSGTEFYFDNGHPNLTCLIGGQDLGEDENRYSFYWGYVSKQGVLQQLNQTTDENLPEGSQIVKRNKIYNVQVSNIVSFGTFKCSVYMNNDDGSQSFLGTAAILITNKLQVEGTYSLVIENGAAAFQYDENGVSPTNKSLNNPQTIQALSFTLYDNAGNALEVNTSNSQIRWIFPVENTLLVKSSQVDAVQPYPDAPYVYIDNALELPYQIANRYNINNQNNQIKLQINYQMNISLSAITQFTFVKQGDPGTNGTNYVVRVLPNTGMNEPPLRPMITQIGDGNELDQCIVNYGVGMMNTETKTSFTKGSGLAFFKVQLWESGELVWQGVSFENNNYNVEKSSIQPAQVYWQSLKDKYDQHVFEIDDHTSGIFKYVGRGRWPGKSLATIIKCTISYQGRNYYGTLPVIIRNIIDENYKFKLKDNTGFDYVLYTSDGVSPQYARYLFEIQCQKKSGDEKWEDISLNENISYTFQPISKQIIIDENNNEEDLNLLKIVQREGTHQKNQFEVSPAAQYDGACVNIAVLCTIIQTIQSDDTQISKEIGKLRIPIHFLLNKYGLAHLNEWDGNSIQIKDDGGYILSPQMGAGEKNENNQFTGVLMGEVKEAGKKSSQVGLFGYANGDRTFFLDSKSGGALLGKNNAGRIIINPSSNKAILVSNNYWSDDNFNDSGFPKDVNKKSNGGKDKDGKSIGAGMLIDLSTPQIKFGSGNFSVTKEGYLHAVGGGDIAGWQITDDELIGTWNLNGKITSTHLRKNGVIYSGKHNSLRVNTNENQTPEEGFYLSEYGLSIGSKFIVDKNGVLKLGDGATLNPIDKFKKHWTIDSNDSGQSYIAYGGTTALSEANNDNDTTAQVYLGTDGISLGTRFSITNQGALKAYSGEIGGWVISKTQLKSSSNNIVLKANGSIEGGKTGTKDGKDYNYTWSIGTDGKAKFNYITANNGGKIGGWTINGNMLSSNGLILNGNNGTITGGGMAWNGNDININISGLGSCAPGLTTGAGSMYGSSGFLGSKSEGNAPLKWSNGELSLNNGVTIGNLEINENGWITHKKGEVLITNDSVYAKTLITDDGVQFGSEKEDLKITPSIMRLARSGKLTFSDGSTMIFTRGFLTSVTSKSSEVKWS